MVVAAINPIHAAGISLWPMLAQSTRTVRNQNDIWFFLIVLVVAAFVIAIIGLIARKMLGSPIESNEGEPVFDLLELRRLHRGGQLTDEEFQTARAAAIKDSTGYQDEAADTTATEAPRATPGSHDIDLGPELLDGSDPPDAPDESDKPHRDP